MHVYKLVKEFGEGVDRMFREMAAAGQPEPRYQAVEFMVRATIWQHEVVGKMNLTKLRANLTKLGRILTKLKVNLTKCRK